MNFKYLQFVMRDLQRAEEDLAAAQSNVVVGSSFYGRMIDLIAEVRGLSEDLQEAPLSFRPQPCDYNFLEDLDKAIEEKKEASFAPDVQAAVDMILSKKPKAKKRKK